MKLNYFPALTLLLLLISCGSAVVTKTSDNSKTTINSLTFIDEVVIPSETIYDNTRVGGLSGIDYKNGIWYILSDDRSNPRFYTAEIDITDQGIQTPQITKVINLKDETQLDFKADQADPESLRVTDSGEIIWSSEGNINKGIDPFIRKATLDGSFTKNILIPNRYLVQDDPLKGPRNNGVFEALTISYDTKGFWVATELPLIEDGFSPTSNCNNAPVRIAYIDQDNDTFRTEYAYQLDKVARKGSLEVNGVTELLSYDEHSFLVLERSYASGYDDGGNDIKIYKVDTSQSTDVSRLNKLSTANYVSATKTLLLDFSTIREQLTDGIVDNIEGMTFGPDFENGNKSLVVISDNNFNSFGKQLTQLILFEVK